MPEPIVYLGGRFLPKSEAHVSPDDRGFLFADGAYEVVRFYGGRPFALAEHLERLARSLAALRIEGVEVEEIGEIARRLVRENGLAEATCYVQITRGAAPRRHAFPAPGTPPSVYASAAPLEVDPARWEHGASVILVPDERWARCDIKSIALLPNILAHQRAREAGADEAVLVREGVVTEGSHTNVAAVFGGRLVTHPEGPRILPGVTRRVVLGLCKMLGIPVEERPIPAEALPRADEVMILSTTSEVLPVVRVDGREVGGGVPGPVARRLLAAFRARVEAETGG